ncbi:hypothetical protein JKP88DRAFT_241186 [Tribonema minus]|uniref:Uncharacterized protein n=1 Tax=Tribonema minus TaxID=303371 RepID=A0A836CEK1_9STRA|nr:hypothetical protein JKP88DRAFT_241186 [Tribonema minus]
MTDTTDRADDRAAIAAFLLKTDAAVRTAIECGKRIVHVSVPAAQYPLEPYNDDVVATRLFAAISELGYHVTRSAFPFHNTATLQWKELTTPQQRPPEKKKWYQSLC